MWIYRWLVCLYFLIFPKEHKPLTKAFHPHWSYAFQTSCCHDSPWALFACSVLLLQLVLGIFLLFRLSAGVKGSGWWISVVCYMLVVIFHVSGRMDVTSELKIFSLILSATFFVFQILFIMLNAVLAFPSPLVPLSTAIMLPSYIKLSANSSWLWSMIIGTLFLLLILMTFVFDVLLLSAV